MEQDYGEILRLDYDEPYQIPCVDSEAVVFMGGRKTKSLNGFWNFQIDVFDTFLRKRFFEERATDDKGRKRPVDFSFDTWEKISVPSNWNTEKESWRYYEGSAVYVKDFAWTPDSAENRVFLRVGAANYECRAWLNGELIGRHKGGFTPFYLELTGRLQAENRLFLVVNNQRRREAVPSLNFDWFNYGGVYRDVELVTVPKCFIRDMSAALKPDGTFQKILLRAEISEAKSQVPCRFQIPDLGVDITAYTDKHGIAAIEAEAQPRLWSCEDPVRYKVLLSTPEDSVWDMIGFREIRVEGREILLNGSPVFLKGVCCHEEYAPRGHALTEEDRIRMLKTAKELGCNVMRLTHYPHSEKMACLADEMGMLLWEEIPVYWALDFECPDTYEAAAGQLKELILRDHNRASVVIWSVGNENPDTDARFQFMEKLAGLCRKMDPTRPISAACLVDVDAMDVHDRLCSVVDIVAFNEYYGWYYRDYEGLTKIFDNTVLDKPMVISETGAGAASGYFGNDEELFTEEHQAKVYRSQFKQMDGRVQGVFPWVLFDFCSPVRMNTLQNQHNVKGLVSADWKYRKQAFSIVQDYYSKK